MSPFKFTVKRDDTLAVQSLAARKIILPSRFLRVSHSQNHIHLLLLHIKREILGGACTAAAPPPYGIDIHTCSHIAIKVGTDLDDILASKLGFASKKRAFLIGSLQRSCLLVAFPDRTQVRDSRLA